MKRFLILLALCFPVAAWAVIPYTEFYCIAGAGGNTNSGHTTSSTPIAANQNGNWDATTGIFVCSAAVNLSGVVAGDWMSVYVDGATTAPFRAQITTVVDATDTITVSLTRASGDIPTTSATGRSMVIGGALNGPSVIDNTIFRYLNGTMTNAAGDGVRFNCKGTFNVTNTIFLTNVLGMQLTFQGYTNTVGDLGCATIDGGIVGAGYHLISSTGGNRITYADLIVTNNGASSTATCAGINNTCSETMFLRVRCYSMWREGIRNAGVGVIDSCYVSGCNKGNTASVGGFYTGVSGGVIVNSISESNTAGANCVGMEIDGSSKIDNCISRRNGGDGMRSLSTVHNFISGCDVWANGGYGYNNSTANGLNLNIRNCNFLANALGGIRNNGTRWSNGRISQVGFGTGTQTNAGGSFSVNGGFNMVTNDILLYAADYVPWVDPTNGNFRLKSDSPGKAAGYGYFNQPLVNSPTNTVAFPDIGVQSASTNAPTTIVYGSTQ